jgi:protein involved in temperature-dependent protein secretion
MDPPDDYAEATARGMRLREGPTAISARYDERLDEIVVRISNGVGVLITPAETQGLAGASTADLSDIEITPSGLGLHWPRLDADVYLPALLEGLTGSETWMASRLGRKGGQAVSASKAAAARENGRRGGRPRLANEKSRPG